MTSWRRGLERGVEQFGGVLAEHGLRDSEVEAAVVALRQRLATDRLVVAFVAEFSRGKSELINALFFADSGRRVLPATPGRTTMCPVELAWDGSQPPSLSLLPIDTRADGQTVTALRERAELWRSVPLPVADPEAMAAVLDEVTHTRQVPVDEARSLGFWDDEHPDDNPPQDADGLVEVPAWRHALINYPHPLLKRGLVVIDTPGLNAIGAEPELTLGLLPSAHATVYLLAADTGVTRSDLAIWRDHLDDRARERFVVLNKIDTLADPLLTEAEIEAQIERQCADVAQTLEVPLNRVYPLSARLALTARVHGDAEGLFASRLPMLEEALQAQLLPQRSLAVAKMFQDGLDALLKSAQRTLAERQRAAVDQVDELRGLRGKSAGRLALMGSRLQAEAAEFERCVPRLQALRSVLSKQLSSVMDILSTDRVRTAVHRMRQGADGTLLRLGAGRAFATMGRDLRGALVEAEGRAAEIEAMLKAGQQQLNAECGFALAVSGRPSLDTFSRELDRIEAGYGKYLGVTQVWRQAQPGFMEQFTRMLQSRLRVVFEGAAVEVELWAKAAGHQMDEQLRERRRALTQRREAFARIQSAEADLEHSIADQESQEQQCQRLSERLAEQADQLRGLAGSPPALELDLPLPLTSPGALPRLHLVQSASAAA